MKFLNHSNCNSLENLLDRQSGGEPLIFLLEFYFRRIDRLRISIFFKGSFFFVFIFFLLMGSLTFAQSKTNLELFFQLVDSSVVRINNEIASGKDCRLIFNTDDAYSVFQNSIINNFQKLGRKIITVNDDQLKPEIINYLITDASVEYDGDMFRDGFLGEFKIKRKINFEGNYSITGNPVSADNFNFTIIDTVAVDKVSTLENPAFPITKGAVPAEPFFSSLLEPIVAIGSAAVAVILFFTVRSK